MLSSFTTHSSETPAASRSLERSCAVVPVAGFPIWTNLDCNSRYLSLEMKSGVNSSSSTATASVSAAVVANRLFVRVAAADDLPNAVCAAGIGLHAAVCDTDSSEKLAMLNLINIIGYDFCIVRIWFVVENPESRLLDKQCCAIQIFDYAS